MNIIRFTKRDVNIEFNEIKFGPTKVDVLIHDGKTKHIFLVGREVFSNLTSDFDR